MAITLPDFTTLPDVTPRAVGGVPSLPAEDPGAAGLAVLGKGVSAAAGAITDIAAYREVRQTKMDQATAEADFLARTMPLTEQLKNETDPEKITALRGQFGQALQASSNAIGNPEARALWLLQNQKHALQGERDVDLRNMVVYHDRWKGQASKLVDELARGAATSTDPQAADLANLRIDQLTEEGAKSGSLTATEAQALNSRAKAQLITGRIDTLAARGQADEARTLLEANRADLGPVAAAHLDDAIERRGRIRRDEDEKRQGEDYERYLNGEGPRPLAPGARSRAALIPYTPAQDILSGTGLSADQYQTFRSHVAERESGSYAQPPNKGGYMGRYQMGQAEIRETADRLGVPVPSQQQFLGDPQLQERFFENYTLDHHNQLMEQSEKYRNASPTERAGILMGAHLGGVGGVTNYLTGKGDPADANGTHVSDYVRSMGRAMAGAAQPGAAPGAPPPGGIEVWGDSLGVGLKGRLDAGGTAVGSARPTAIFDNIKKQPETSWEGKTVVLPSGSNGNEMPVVENTIKYLQDHKANVIAVGYGPKFPEKNAQLREIAARLKVPVVDAEGVDPGEGVHPSPRGYQSMAEKIRAAASGPSASGPAAAPPGAGGDTAQRPPAGQLEPGNIDLGARPVVKNPDGSISTVRSIGIEEGGKQVLIPTVAADGSRILTNDEAVQQYHDTGQHLGKFDTVDNANAAAEQLHQAQAAQYAPPGAAPTEAAKPDWAALAQRIRDSDLPPGAKTEAFRRLEARKQMAEFGTQEPKQQYNARVHAAVEQRIDDIVQGAARSDDPAVRAKAEQDLSAIIKWGVDTGAVPANKGYEAERAAKTQLITGRAQYLDGSGQSDAALALIQQNKDTLPPQIYQEQVRNLTARAETQQGTRFERELQIGGGPGYVPGEPTPGMLPGASAESPISTAPSPLQQKLQAIADSDLPDAAKKAAHAAALQRHELEIVGQDRAKSDLDLAIAKGQAGRIDIEQAYRDGRIAPSARTEMHRVLDKIEADRDAAAVAMAKVNNAANGGAPLDPKSDYDKKALNYHFDKVSAGWPADEVTARSLDYAAKYGLLPERFKGLIRGSLHSGNPADMVAAADTINRIRNRNPQLVGEIGDENDLRLATLLQTYTDAGIKPEAAVQLAAAGMKVGKPEQEARSEAFKSKADQHDADSKWLSNQLNSIWRPDPDVDPVMRKEFEEVSRAEYQRTGNLEASRRMALDNMNGVWGRTRVGGDLRYMKNSPEQKYGVPGLSDRENAAWMNEQLLSDTTRGALQDPTNPITADRLHLVRAPDWIDRDGRPAYQVFLEHPTTKTWELIRRPDGEARVWAPDWATSAEKQRRDVALQDRIGMLRQERRIGGFVGTGAP